ncbi:MAG: hypothetical protein H7222_15570 [Methylotenera sp.]|nr:hypothetical protein [Oligoflexia bacterium]
MMKRNEFIQLSLSLAAVGLINVATACTERGKEIQQPGRSSEVNDENCKASNSEQCQKKTTGFGKPSLDQPVHE